MLKAHEELWEMTLSPLVSRLITKMNGKVRKDKTRAVTCKVPFNSAVQVYNFTRQDNRVAFGPC